MNGRRYDPFATILPSRTGGQHWQNRSPDQNRANCGRPIWPRRQRGARLGSEGRRAALDARRGSAGGSPRTLGSAIFPDRRSSPAPANRQNRGSPRQAQLLRASAAGPMRRRRTREKGGGPVRRWWAPGWSGQQTRFSRYGGGVPDDRSGKPCPRGKQDSLITTICLSCGTHVVRAGNLRLLSRPGSRGGRSRGSAGPTCDPRALGGHSLGANC